MKIKSNTPSHRTLLSGLFFLLLCISACSHLPQIIETLTAPTPTAQAVQAPPCGWAWARQALPELNATVVQAFQSAGIAEVRVEVYLFGENCVPMNADETGYFAAMETDFDVHYSVDSFDDKEVLGNQAADILGVLASLPTDDFPTANPIIRLIIMTPDGTTTLRIPYAQSGDFTQQGVRGAALWAAIGGP